MSKLNTNKEQPDFLGDLFSRIPEEELPASFRSNVMRQIMLESVKAIQPASGNPCVAYHDFPRRRIFHLHGDTSDQPPSPRHIGLGFLSIYRSHSTHPPTSGL